MCCQSSRLLARSRGIAGEAIWLQNNSQHIVFSFLYSVFEVPSCLTIPRRSKFVEHMMSRGVQKLICPCFTIQNQEKLLVSVMLEFPVFVRMRSFGLQPDSQSYTAAIGACGVAGHWEEALKLLHRAETEITRERARRE